MAVLEGREAGRVVGGGGDGTGLQDTGAAVGQSVVVLHSTGRHPTLNLTKLPLLNVWLKTLPTFTAVKLGLQFYVGNNETQIYLDILELDAEPRTWQKKNFLN